MRAKPSAVADIGVDDDIPTRTMLIGTVIVIGAGIFIIWREHKLGLERRGAPQAPDAAGVRLPLIRPVGHLLPARGGEGICRPLCRSQDRPFATVVPSPRRRGEG